MFPYRTNWSLKQWQTFMTSMYGKTNSLRKPLETLARLTEMATGISRGVREDDSNLLKKFFPRYLAWLIGLATQVDVDLEEAVWNSYPGVCCYCRKPSGCSCKLDQVKTSRLSDDAEIKSLQAIYMKPRNLVEWVAMFSGIYQAINKNTGPMKMVGHFIEELGEVGEILRFSFVSKEQLKEWNVELTHEEIRRYLHQEFADIFAWYCGLAHHMGIEVDAYMKDIYQAVCPECIQMTCNCSPYRVHKGLRLGAKN